MKIILVIIFFFSACTTQANDMLDDLGLAWGQSQKTLIENNFNLTECKSEAEITSCEVIHSAQGVAYGAQYILYFVQNKGVQKIQMPIRFLQGDMTGSEGKGLYNQLKNYLTLRNDAPKSSEYVGRKLYGEYDEFYQCLKYKGCGSWVSFWELENGDYTYIALYGIAPGTGYLVLFNESKLWVDTVKNSK